jgi:surface antigen
MYQGDYFMRIQNIAVLIVSGGLVAGCAADAGPKETSGALIGGVAGGLLGSTVGDGRTQVAATVLGAALGAVVGGAVGRNLDEADREYAYRAANEALLAGEEEEWENPQTGHRGKFVPRKSYYNAQRSLCRDFEHTIWVNGEPEVIDGTACQLAEGSWRVVA